MTLNKSPTSHETPQNTAAYDVQWICAMLKQVVLPNGSILWAGLRRVRRPTRNWIVLLPESGAGLIRATRQDIEDLVGREAAQRHHFLVINKTGLNPRGKDPRGFEQAFRREQRIADALEAIRQIVPKADKIFLVGYSEGAYLAPQIAIRDRRVARIALIGGGTRGWLAEELGNAEARKKAILRRQIERIYQSPKSTRKWNGFSFATWYSYRGHQTLHALKSLKVPVTAVLGARDRTIDYRATLSDLRRLQASRADVQVEVLPDCGHSFAGHWPDVRLILKRVIS